MIHAGGFIPIFDPDILSRKFTILQSVSRLTETTFATTYPARAFFVYSSSSEPSSIWVAGTGAFCRDRMGKDARRIFAGRRPPRRYRENLRRRASLRDVRVDLQRPRIGKAGPSRTCASRGFQAQGAAADERDSHRTARSSPFQPTCCLAGFPIRGAVVAIHGHAPAASLGFMIRKPSAFFVTHR